MMRKFFFLMLLSLALFGGERLTMLETEAKSYLGNNYVWGGENPNGFDCSGYTRYVYQKIGISLPRTAFEQSKVGRSISSVNQLEKGDLLFFLTDRRRGIPITHVGIYLGDGNFIHAAGQKFGIITSSLNGKYGRLLVKATRPTDMLLSVKNEIMTPQFFSVEVRAMRSPTKIEVKYNFYSLNKDGFYSR